MVVVGGGRGAQAVESAVALRQVSRPLSSGPGLYACRDVPEAAGAGWTADAVEAVNGTLAAEAVHIGVLPAEDAEGTGWAAHAAEGASGADLTAHAAASIGGAGRAAHAADEVGCTLATADVDGALADEDADGALADEDADGALAAKAAGTADWAAHAAAGESGVVLAAHDAEGTAGSGEIADWGAYTAADIRYAPHTAAGD